MKRIVFALTALTIGATMRVGSFQPFGAYTGVMATTVEYN